jgi:MFS family permease
MGTALAGAAFLGLGIAAGFYSILVLLFIAGVGNSFQHPLASALISGAYPEEGRRIALGTYNFFGDIGKVSVAGGTSLCLVAGIGWKVPAVAAGALALAFALAILLLLNNSGAGAKPAKPAAHSTATAVRGWGIRHRQGWLALCAIEIIDNATRNGFLTFLAFLMLAKGLPEGWAVMSVPLVALGGTAGKLACGFLAERLGVIRTIILTEVATGVGIVLALLLPPLAAYALLPLIGVALNGTSSALYGTVGDLVEPERVSRAFGLFYTLGSTCGVVAPLLYGLLADVVGIEMTMALVAMIVFTAVPLCMLLRPALGQLRAARPA